MEEGGNEKLTLLLEVWVFYVVGQLCIMINRGKRLMARERCYGDN